MWRLAFAAGVIALSAVAAKAQVNPDDLTWGPAPTIFPEGAKMAVLAGDPGKPGVFVIRLQMPAGYKIPAHHHPTDEYVTVISGDFRLGMGDKLAPSQTKLLGPGGFGVAPQGMNHYAWTEGGTVVQVSAEGPFAMVYVNPADDPTKSSSKR